MNKLDYRNNQEELLQECADLGLSGLGDEYKEYELDLQRSEKELEVLLNLNLDKHAEAITFEQLCSITFIKAKQIIFKMTVKKRIGILKELDFRLMHLYDGVKGYNDQGFGKSLSPKVFQQMMGKIKHMEILQQWLYGIE